MRALITGGTGFLGANIAAALAARGWQVRVLRREHSPLEALEGVAVEHAIGDVLDQPSLRRALDGCDALFHVAGLSQYWRVSKEKVYAVNVEGTRNVMEAALELGVARVVHTSSIAAFGVPEQEDPRNESFGFPSASEGWAYGHSKWLAEREVLARVERGLHAVIVNPAIIMGPRDIHFVGGSLLRASLQGQLRVVPPGGSSTIHSDDVVHGHVAALEQGRSGERYILGAENLSHREMADILSDVTGGARPLAVLPHAVVPFVAGAVDLFNSLRKGVPLVSGEQIRLSVHRFYMDSSKAVRELGLPQTPFRTAAQDAFRWYREHGLL